MTKSEDVSPRMKRRRETTQRILDAAMRLMIEDGWEGFTIARLAKELGYAVGALYRYFKGKDAILAALEMRVVADLADDLGHVAEAVDKLVEREAFDAEQASLLHVLAAFGVYESLSLRKPTAYRLLTMSLADPRELLEAELMDGQLPALNEVLGVVSARIDAAQEVGALSSGDATSRTLVLWGATQGVVQLRKLTRLDVIIASRALTDSLLAGQLVGWGASGGVRELQVTARQLVDATLTSAAVN